MKGDDLGMDGKHTNISKAGGLSLALGAMGYTIAVILYVAVYGQAEGTGADGAITMPDRVIHLKANLRFVQAMWWIETAAAILMAVAGFLLVHRNSEAKTWLTPQAAWSVTGVGGILLFMMYPVMLAGYPEALKYFSSEPGLMAVLHRVATFIFYVANLVLFVGLAGGFHLEQEPDGVLPNWFARLGVAICLIGALGFCAMIAGANIMNLFAPIGLLIFVLASFLGIAIWREAARGRLR